MPTAFTRCSRHEHNEKASVDWIITECNPAVAELVYLYNTNMEINANESTKNKSCCYEIVLFILRNSGMLRMQLHFSIIAITNHHYPTWISFTWERFDIVRGIHSEKVGVAWVVGGGRPCVTVTMMRWWRTWRREQLSTSSSSSCRVAKHQSQYHRATSVTAWYRPGTPRWHCTLSTAPSHHHRHHHHWVKSRLRASTCSRAKGRNGEVVYLFFMSMS